MKARSSLEELTATAEGRRLLEQEVLLLSATELICELMERKGVTRAELARRIGKSKAFVTQILRGSRNMTLRTLADFAWALETRVRLSPASWVAESQAQLWAAILPRPAFEAELPKSVPGIPTTRRALVSFTPTVEAA